ncbi:hypothetical protein BC332_33691 [Capsicum chinense]|nr:hypothetical protein BC332_33691 [Capsicum chinense]
MEGSLGDIATAVIRYLPACLDGGQGANASTCCDWRRDYTDFFSSMHHAKNCGTIIRGPQNPINLNFGMLSTHPPVKRQDVLAVAIHASPCRCWGAGWGAEFPYPRVHIHICLITLFRFHLPIAYLGRASFIVISGTDIIRPRYNTVEQRKVLWDQLRFDVAPVISKRIRDFASCVQDLMLNEITCKARDIQAWEYVPLGPFLQKSFGTTISPWIVTLDALEPFACEAPKPNPSPSSDHVEKSSRNYDISLEVSSAPCVHDRV